MFNWWNKRLSRKETASDIYGAIVSRARQPSFFELCGASDTPEGRFELIILNMALVLERLRLSEDTDIDLRRRVIEAFVTDVDDNMREMGVGDMSVPRKVKRAAASLMERMEQYRNALAAQSDADLIEALASNIPGLATKPNGAERMALVLRADVSHLESLSDASVQSGNLSFSAI